MNQIEHITAQTTFVAIIICFSNCSMIGYISANFTPIITRTNVEDNIKTSTLSLIHITDNQRKNSSYMCLINTTVVLCQFFLSVSAILPIVNFDLKKVLDDMSIERSVIFYLCGGYVVLQKRGKVLKNLIFQA